MFYRKIFVVIAVCCLSVATAQAQTISPSGDASDGLSQEVLHALQQRGAQSTQPQLQPSVQIEKPAAYPEPPPPANDTALSPLEKLMSSRTGQRIKQFGYDTFGQGSPVIVHQSGALQDNYVLGEGDEIVVTMHGQQNANYRTRVDRDGRVLLPGLSPLAASGRSFGDFRSDLEGAVRRAFVGTDVSVSVGAVREVSVRVLGEVHSPGVYSLTSLSTVLDALNLADGVKKTGSLRDIRIVRGNRSLHLDLYSLLTDRDAKTDIALAEGDRIVVPLLTRAVAAVGEVKRPAIYELAPGETGARALALLDLAGGPEVRGAYRFSVLKTREDGRREMVQINPQSEMLVHDGDALFVTPSIDVSLAKVELMGGTASQNYFSLDSAPTLHALLKSTDMLSPKPGQPLPYLLLSAIIRIDPETMQRSVIPFSALDAISGKTDVPLQSNDIVYILNVPEMRYIARRAAAAQILMNADEAAHGAPHDNGQPVSASILQTSSVSGLQTTLKSAVNTNSAGQQMQQETADPDTKSTETKQIATSNDDLPDLKGIPAPPQTLTPADTTAQAMPMKTNGSITARNPGARQAMEQTNLRLFVDLDDDERQLLINTLSNYCVSISGEVNNPGAFLIMPQTGLDKIVQAAGGLTPNVDLNDFEVSSAEVDNRSGTSRTMRKAYSLARNQFVQVTLKPMDSVRFNKVFSDSIGEAQVYGEVRYPGTYSIARGERLSSVLARAGGLTDTAYTYGAIFLRRSVAEQERGVLQREADSLESELVGLMGTASATRPQLSDSEVQYVTHMAESLRGAEGQGGRVAVQIDPQKIAEHPELDATLEPGDQLFIPRKPNSVVVAGEVMSPSGIQYAQDLSVSDYVARAGGTTQIADDDHIFIIEPDGSAVQAGHSFWGSSPRLEPGSVIVVPRTLRPFTWDSFLQDAIQATSQLAITAASIAVITR
jgi:polysaccharide export outer membrane protein